MELMEWMPELLMILGTSVFLGVFALMREMSNYGDVLICTLSGAIMLILVVATRSISVLLVGFESSADVIAALLLAVAAIIVWLMFFRTYRRSRVLTR